MSMSNKILLSTRSETASKAKDRVIEDVYDQDVN